jgi:hypothetical protein
MSNNSNKVVKFTNISTKDFTHSYGGQPFFVKAGETVMLPYDLADHLATHLARRIFIDRDSSPSTYDPKDATSGHGRPLWDDSAEAEMKAKILGEIFEEASPVKKTEMQMLQDKVNELAQRFTDAPVTADPATYKDKAEVIKALEAKGIKFDPRAKKADLEQLLAEPVVASPQ